MNKNEKRAYQNTSQTTSSHEFSVVGKAEIRIGIGLDGGISIINKDLAHAGVGVEFGVYNEYFATAKVEYTTKYNDNDSGIYAKIELGIYLKVKLDCSVDALFFKVEYKADLAELKYPVFKIETGVDWSENENEQNVTNTQQNTNVNNHQNTSTNISTNTSSNTGTETGVVGSLSIDTESESIKAYKKYILDKKYVDDYKNYFQEEGWNNNILKDVGYCIFDINQDGIPELIIDADSIDSEWRIDALYTYNKESKSVMKVDMIYNYAGLRYEKNEHELVYTELRPNANVGSYGFFKLEKDTLVFIKSVGHDISDSYDYDKSINSIIWDANSQKKYITQEEERAYFDNVIDFSYQDITKVK